MSTISKKLPITMSVILKVALLQLHASAYISNKFR